MIPIDTLKLGWRFALRELRGGLSGFYVFLACIALGTAAIGGVNAVSQAITQGIEAEGQSILGGDLRFELIHRTATANELATLQSFGQVAQSATTRSTARLRDQSDQTLVEIKAVDDRYPLYGSFVIEPDIPLGDLGERDGVWGIAAQPILLERLGLALGDDVLIGDGRYAIRSLIVSEPDALSDGIGLAPRLIMPLPALEASGLIQPGSLINHVYKIRFAEGTTETRLQTAIDTARQAHPDAGWEVRGRSNAAPALSTNVERFAQFLTLVGLTALVTGGVGVANAVRAFLESKRDVIATFKCLGAPGGLVTLIYLFQILIIAAVGIAVAGFGIFFGLSNSFRGLGFLGRLHLPRLTRDILRRPITVRAGGLSQRRSGDRAGNT